MTDSQNIITAAINRLKQINKYDLAFYIALFIFSITALFIFTDYGIGFDGPRQKTYGEASLNYYLSGFADKSSLSYINLYYYGGLFDMLAALANKFSPLGAYETRHLLNALVGILGILGVWKLTRLLAGARAALTAALLLMLTPSYFGHMFMNPKDIPFAVGYVWSMYYILFAFRSFPKLKPTLILRLGLALGLTLAVRIGGALLVVYTCMGFGLFVISPSLFGIENTNEVWWKSGLRRLLTPGIALGAAFVIAYAVMLIFWPWAQQDPLHNPFKALQFMSKFGDWPGTVLLNGTYVEAMHLPKSYLPHYFSVKLPESMFFCAIIGAFALIYAVLKRRLSLNIQKLTLLGFLLFSIAFPVIYAIAKHSVLYDGIRHFLFIIPLLVIICALAFELFLRSASNRTVRTGTIFILAIILTMQTAAMIRLHPDQYVYYNIFTGGTKGADGKYEMDYWANSYKEAVETIEKYAKKRDRADFENRTYMIYADGPYLSAIYYFPKNFKHTLDPKIADFYFVHTRWNLEKKLPGKPLTSVSKMGVVLTLINEKQ